MTSGLYFHMRERLDSDGVLCLQLIGELDIGSVEQLASRLERERAGGTPVRLDLRRLDFLDSSGIAELLDATSDARRRGWRLEIGTDLNPQVRRVIDLTEVGALLWPEPARAR